MTFICHLSTTVTYQTELNNTWIFLTLVNNTHLHTKAYKFTVMGHWDNTLKQTSIVIVFVDSVKIHTALPE